MRTEPTFPPHQPVPIRGLRITTSILLDPDFIANPQAFARQHSVELAGEVSPATHCRRNPDDPNDHELHRCVRWNIHLVRHGAIRLFAERAINKTSEWLKSIEIDPAMLLYEAERHPLVEGDLPRSLEILRDKVSPLLANPTEARHIVPGAVQDEGGVAFWSKVDSEILLPGIQIPCLHKLSHPSTGAEEGRTDSFVRLGNKSEPCVIRIEKTRWMSATPDGNESVEGIRVGLTLKGNSLVGAFKKLGKVATISGAERLVLLPELSVARVHQAMMARLEGTYLPVPPEWRDRALGKPLTSAKILALLPYLTGKSSEDLQATYEQMNRTSLSTKKRLKKDLRVESDRLAAVDVSTLFHPSAYGLPTTEAPVP